ncbi:MAG: fibronectin type III domain-containing protein, partial [Micromonosporaceae bacterium]|nr:fibronectin type III domain-containing protein [Micromonosporaceae bacterium]
MSSTLAGGSQRQKGALVTVGTVVGLIIAVVVTLFGTGAADHAVASFDASSWLFSKQKGEIARVNGVTGKVDTRTKISDSQGHSMEVTQNDRFVILRDLTTGKVSVLDLSNLQIGATTQTTPGLGVTVALHEDSAFLVDSAQGVIRQLNPSTLSLVGQPLNFPPGISGGQFDHDGRLWILVPSEGTAVAIKPAPNARPVLAGADSADAGAGAGAGDTTATTSTSGGNPAIARTVSVADPSHELTLSVLDAGVAVLDKTSMMLITVQGEAERSVTLPLKGPGALPSRTVGEAVPVTVVDDRHVYVVTGDTVTDFAVPGTSPSLQPCTPWAGRLYCPDDVTGTVYVLDSTGKLASTFTVPSNGTALELEVREGRLFINAPGTANARVVDDNHKVKTVNKYVNNVLGGDPPPQVVTTPPKPPTGPPSAPAEVKATAGDQQVRLSWSAAAANGFAIMKYVVEGDGKTYDVGANQRALDITGLVNGQKYTFTVYAVNAKGRGPKKASNPVTPTADVPDPPASVTAEAKPDGTVVVKWPAANGQGNKIARYDLTAASTGSQDPVGSSTTTSFTVPAGKLTYGTQYALTVTTVTEKGASSVASPASNTVVPYTTPGKPAVSATTAADKQGTVKVTWAAAPENGRAITKYVVAAGSVTQELDSTARSSTISGLANGATVTVKVHA